MLIQSLFLNLHANLSPFVVKSEAKDLENIYALCYRDFSDRVLNNTSSLHFVPF